MEESECKSNPEKAWRFLTVMEKITYEQIVKDPLYKKLEKIITRNWWNNHSFDKNSFAIYSEAVKIEARFFDSEFIESREYKTLLEMKDDALKEYVQGVVGLLGG